MRRSRRLWLEQLEERTVPSALDPLGGGGGGSPPPPGGGGGVAPPPLLGMPWPDATRLSLSFAPDGTLVDGQASALFGTLSALPTAAWQSEILRAFQTWAANANINLGLVDDGGQDFGIAGAVEGDTRFGDIRLGARSFDTHLAMSAPFQVLTATRAGDVLLNTDLTWGIGDPSTTDVYSVLVQEAGNVFGIIDNLDDSSAMYSFYNGIRTGLSADDVNSIQLLYGARLADEYEGLAGNDKFLDAVAVDTSAIVPDITFTTDVDYFKFTVPYGVTSFSVRVQAGGVSLLTPHLSVYNGDQQEIASALSTDPLDNTVVLQIDDAASGGEYYIKVQGARQDVFGVGAYRLRVFTGPAADMEAGAANNEFTEAPVLDDTDTDNDMASAVYLDSSDYQSDTRFDVRAQGVLGHAGDVDWYRFTAPDVTTSMVVMAWGADQNALDPTVVVYDEFGTPLTADVLVNDDGSYVLKASALVPNAVYYAQVLPGNPEANNTGGYVLTVAFGDGTPVLQSAGTGALGDTTVQSWRTLHNLEGQVMHFVLSSSDDALVNSAVRMTIYDANNNLVMTLVSRNGESVSGNLYLTAGDYTVRIEGGNATGDPLEAIFFDIRGTGVTDPMDPLPLDTTTMPIGITLPKFSWLQFDDSYYSILDIVDPYSNPWWGL